MAEQVLRRIAEAASQAVESLERHVAERTLLLTTAVERVREKKFKVKECTAAIEHSESTELVSALSQHAEELKQLCRERDDITAEVQAAREQFSRDQLQQLATPLAAYLGQNGDFQRDVGMMDPPDGAPGAAMQDHAENAAAQLTPPNFAGHSHPGNGAVDPQDHPREPHAECTNCKESGSHDHNRGQLLLCQAKIRGRVCNKACHTMCYRPRALPDFAENSDNSPFICTDCGVKWGITEGGQYIAMTMHAGESVSLGRKTITFNKLLEKGGIVEITDPVIVSICREVLRPGIWTKREVVVQAYWEEYPHLANKNSASGMVSESYLYPTQGARIFRGNVENVVRGSGRVFATRYRDGKPTSPELIVTP